MTLVYNIEAFKEGWVFKKGDTVNFPRTVTKYNPATGLYDPYDMTGMQIDIWVRRYDSLVVKKWTTLGGSPTITIVTDTFTIYDTGFLESGYFKADVQITDGVDIGTIGDIDVKVEKDYTT